MAQALKGNLALEQENWQVACAEYLTALTTCKSIATIYSDDGNLELFDFFTTRAQNVIAPLLRYCQYELLVRFLLALLDDSILSRLLNLQPTEQCLHRREG